MNFENDVNLFRSHRFLYFYGATDVSQAKFLDIISFNRYNGWYTNPGELDTITSHVVDEAISWNKKTKKPVLMSEYGADTVEGLNLVKFFISFSI